MSACPKCKDKDLQEIEEGGVPFQGCTDCFGLFVTPKDLHQYVVNSTEVEEIGQAFSASTGASAVSARLGS